MLTQKQIDWANNNLKGLTYHELSRKYSHLLGEGTHGKERYKDLVIAWGTVNTKKASNSNDTVKTNNVPQEKLERMEWANNNELQDSSKLVAEVFLEETEESKSSLRVKLNNLIKNYGGKMVPIQDIYEVCDELHYKRSNAERRLRVSESVNVESVMNNKGAIIGYKWKNN